MPAELHAASGGASRKMREVYAASGGANRKQQEMYAASGGAIRKIFSGADAVVTINKIYDLGSLESASLKFNADGSGGVHYRNASESKGRPPSEINISCVITLPDELVWLQGDLLVEIKNAYQEFAGSYVNTSTNGDETVSHRVLDVQPGLRDKKYWKYWLGNYHQIRVTHNVRAQVAGASNTFTVTFSVRCNATRDEDGRFSLSWPAGSWSILGRPLNNIEVTYL